MFSLLPVSGELGIAGCSRVYRTITPGSVDLHASLSTDHRHIILLFACLIFPFGLDREIILTAKISRSTLVGVLVEVQLYEVQQFLGFMNITTALGL